MVWVVVILGILALPVLLYGLSIQGDYLGVFEEDARLDAEEDAEDAEDARKSVD